MPRHKNLNWNLPDGTPNEQGDHTHEWMSIQSALLMDLRDELRDLNTRLGCGEFISLPRVLRRIDRRLERHGFLLVKRRSRGRGIRGKGVKG